MSQIPIIYESSKTFSGFPCAHRKWRHKGHCSFVHGYSRSFTIWFGAHQRSENGFVMDFGDLKEIQKWLDDCFDHTLLLDKDDPLIAEFKTLEKQGGCKLFIMDDCSMEGTAKMIFDHVDTWVQSKTNNRVWVQSVEARENVKNSGRIRRTSPPPHKSN